jgi:hypothetical protein
MKRLLGILLLVATPAFCQDTSKDEAAVWGLEKSYWEDVKTNDMEKYRALWHEDFLGWPWVNPAPTRKDRITDWITAYTSQGLRLQSYAIEPLGAQVTGHVAIDHYRVKTVWGTPEKPEAKMTVTRITHTWIYMKDSWQILGGMSAPVNAEGK